MASTAGFSAWKKYFSGKGDVSTVTKKKTVTYLPNGKIGPTLEQGTNVVAQSITEREYLSYVRGKGTGPKVNAHIPVKTENKVLLCSLDDLAKPREGGVIDLQLQSVFLVKGAREQTIDIMGYTDVKCAVFKTGKELRSSIISNLTKNKLLDTVPAFKKSMITYFESGTPAQIKWMGTVSDGEKAQFAKYVGELVIGLVLLEKKIDAISGTNPFRGKIVKEFIVPLSDSFPGADSIFRLSDGTLIPVSSKADAGAKASFFANILSPLFDHPEYLGTKKSTIKDLYAAAKKAGVSTSAEASRSAKSVVYEYGVRNILGMKETDIKNSYQVFEEFKKYDDLTKYSAPVRTAYNKLKNEMKAVDDITALKNLDSSTTVFFSKMIADRLNKDANSLDVVMKILGSKRYYQANMDVSSLKRNGAIKFTMVLSGEAKINFIGTKSAYTNLEASQGTVNYELKRVK
jgi:hypothetical protein